MNREYNGGQWTVSRYHSFITSLLRSGSRRWPPKYEVLNEAKVGKKINEETGRVAEHYKCAGCGQEFPAKKVQVDHIDPFIPLTGFTTWDDVIHRLFCEKDNLQVLCITCHSKKSAAEKAERTLHNKNKKGK